MAIIILSLTGFFLANYIHWHKTKYVKKLICPIGFDCDSVIHSEYSRFLGIPIEVLGMFYYGLVAFLYGVFVFMPQLANIYLVFLVMSVTTAALLFSAYLTSIQAFLLKQLCSLCLISAALCVGIFFFAVSYSNFGLNNLLSANRTIIMIIHGIGAAIGLGGATISDFFFFRFLKDLRISEWEADVLKSLSQVIWLALVILVVTGIAIYLPEAQIYNESSKFLAKVFIVFVIIINGLLLNLFISPRLVQISFQGRHSHKEGELRSLRRFAFALGAVSIVSWYSAFALGMLKSLPFTIWGILGIYLVLIALAIIVSQIIESRLTRIA